MVRYLYPLPGTWIICGVKTMAGVNSRIAVVTEEEVSQMLAFLEFVTEFVYAKTIILFNLGE